MVVRLLEPGNVVLRYAMLIVRILRLGACVFSVSNSIRVEGRPWGRRASCLITADRLVWLARRTCDRVDVTSPSRASGGCNKPADSPFIYDISAA